MYYEEVLPARNRIGTQKFDIVMRSPGVFFFQFKYDGNKYTEPQWIQVDPNLASQNPDLNVSSLRIQTVLSRSLGNLDRWEDFISTQKELGYNAIHFTPIQTYGESGSHYSIADQLNIDDWFFHDKNLSKEDRFEKLKYHVSKLQLETGMLFFVDIVLNHTAANSEWIKVHPEATYNTDNCPHLKSAYVLDKAMTDFDIAFTNGELPEFPFAPHIETNEQFEQIMTHIKSKILLPLRIYEYFLIDTDTLPEAEEIKSISEEVKQRHSSDLVVHEGENITQFVWDHCTNQGEAPYGTKIKFRSILRFVQNIFPGEKDEFYAQKITHAVAEYNQQAKNMALGFMDEAYDALRGEIKYHKMEINDPERRKGRMITSYFRTLDNPQSTKCVVNGWSMGGDASKQDF
jgi:glycogen debranching enzyme